MHMALGGQLNFVVGIGRGIGTWHIAFGGQIIDGNATLVFKVAGCAANAVDASNSEDSTVKDRVFKEFSSSGSLMK